MQQRHSGIDALKIIACFGVVFLHVTAQSFELGDRLTLNSYLYYLGTISIPIFFLINGYFLLNKKSLIIPYLWKKVQGILLTVITWSLLYWLLSGNIHDNPLRKIIGSLVQRGYFFQFWFFGSLLIIYVTLPIIHRIIQSYKVHFWLTIAFIVLGGVIQGTNYFSANAPIQAHVIQTFRLWTWYSYYLLGGLLGRQQTQDKLDNWNHKWIAGITSISLLVMPLIVYTIANHIFANKYAEYFYDSPLIKLLVVGLFLSLKNCNFNQVMVKIITRLSPLIMGVFIVHYHLMKLIGRWINLEMSLTNLIALILVVISSFAVAAIIRKIPFLKNVISI